MPAGHATRTSRPERIRPSVSVTVRPRLPDTGTNTIRARTPEPSSASTRTRILGAAPAVIVRGPISKRVARGGSGRRTAVPYSTPPAPTPAWEADAPPPDGGGGRAC